MQNFYINQFSKKKHTGNLYLFPNSIGHHEKSMFLPTGVEKIILPIRYFIVENIRTVRRYLRFLNKTFPIDECHFFELNKHTPFTNLQTMIQPLLNGHDVAIISESGCPAIADPGALIVRLAHKKNIRVVPLVGPSSIFLALMASGLNGQQFSFVGYLPINKHEQQKKLHLLEQRSRKHKETILFIETPYRNKKLMDNLLTTLSSSTSLTLAREVNTANEIIETKTISQWKHSSIPDIQKKNTLFLFLAE
jgi:16S rRNA (cytidine1402-2'-O)-methyltransferase